jgi:hypothetical protein
MVPILQLDLFADIKEIEKLLLKQRKDCFIILLKPTNRNI